MAWPHPSRMSFTPNVQAKSLQPGSGTSAPAGLVISASADHRRLIRTLPFQGREARAPCICSIGIILAVYNTTTDQVVSGNKWESFGPRRRVGVPRLTGTENVYCGGASIIHSKSFALAQWAALNRAHESQARPPVYPGFDSLRSPQNGANPGAIVWDHRL